MARVVLEMNVHCTDCAKKIRNAVQDLYGVEKVSASPESGLVVIMGTADPEMLRSRIERKLVRPVKFFGHGGAGPEPVEAHHRWAAPQQHGGAGPEPVEAHHRWAAPRYAPQQHGGAGPEPVDAHHRWAAPRYAPQQHGGAGPHPVEAHHRWAAPRYAPQQHGGVAPHPVDAHRWAAAPRYAPQQHGGGWGMPLPRRYGAPHLGFPYAGNHWMPHREPRRWHASHGAPARQYDDDWEGPQNCCSIQ